MNANKDLSLDDRVSPFAAFEYIPYFDIRTLKPTPGEAVHVFIPERFISFTHPPIADRELFGRDHYSPDSDLAAIVFHSGILFVDPRSKDSSHRQFCVAKNALEGMACSETEYPRRVNIEYIPQDLRLRGVLIFLLFCRSPPFFPASTRNGLRSREADKAEFSMRIANFRIISSFDQKPVIVTPDQVDRHRDFRPQYKKSFTEELSFSYKGGLFSQILSLPNITNGFFSVYRLFFDCECRRYEIKLLDKPDIILSVVQLLDPVSLDTLKRKPSAVSRTTVVVDRCPWTSLSICPDKLVFAGVAFTPVSDISLISLTGKLSRSPNLRLIETEA